MFIYVALGAAVIALLVWAGRRPPLARTELRLAVGAGAAVVAVAAAYVALRGQLLGGAILLAAAAWLAPLARSRRAPPVFGSQMSAEEARSILGVEAGAGREEIQEAYRRLMRRAHPDQGGTTGLAAKLNAARDRLLDG